jgi:hypothetical protein
MVEARRFVRKVGIVNSLLRQLHQNRAISFNGGEQ